MVVLRSCVREPDATALVFQVPRSPFQVPHVPGSRFPEPEPWTL